GEVGIGQSTKEVTNNWAFFSVGTGGENAERAPENLIDSEVELPNKLKLRTKIEVLEDENLEDANLTEESWTALSEILESAKELLDGNPTAEEINRKTSELDEAYNNLQTVTMDYITFFDEPLESNGWVNSWKESNWSLKEDPTRLVHNTLETGGGRK